jgi:hypothetical protein
MLVGCIATVYPRLLGVLSANLNDALALAEFAVAATTGCSGMTLAPIANMPWGDPSEGASCA